MAQKTKKGPVGSSFDSFLQEAGILEIATERAKAKVLARAKNIKKQAASTPLTAPSDTIDLHRKQNKTAEPLSRFGG